MLRVSFIITYYNEPLQMLEECVQSVLSLPLLPMEREILLIDDGSTVPAPEMEGVTVFRQENQGLSAARNKGIELARGDYIQFLDADDFVLPEEYRLVLDMQLSNRPDILMFDFSHDLSRKRYQKGIQLFRSGVDFLRKRNLRGSACCYMFRREILGDLRFLPGIVHEDELFTPQLLLKAELVLVVGCTPYYYRVRTNTITHQQEREHVKRRLHDMLFVVKQLNTLTLTCQGKEHEALQRRVSQLTMDYVYNCWLLSHSFREVMSCLRSLKESALFPLPLKCYTLKYGLFALTVNSLCVFL